MKKIFTALSLFFLPILSSIGQIATSPRDISDLKELVKKEDFENVSKFLKALGFTIYKFDLNYNHSSYYVICEIQCKRKLSMIKSRKDRLFDVEPDEELSIQFYEKENQRELYVSQSYLANYNSFKAYYYEWKMDRNWTYVALGEPNRATFLQLLGKSTKTDSKEFGYEIGKLGVFGPDAKNLKMVPSNSLNLLPGYKKMFFRNDNPNLGSKCIYQCDLDAAWTKDEYYLLADTIYGFRLYTIDYLPRFAQQTSGYNTNSQTIPLLKSGKTYFIYITFGEKKKKYILDSGASDVTIDEYSYKKLVESGIINFKHKLTDANYKIADGSIKTYKRTLIPEFTVGDIVVENIVATIVPDGQPLLLGKSFLDNFKSWKIDNAKNELVVELK